MSNQTSPSCDCHDSNISELANNLTILTFCYVVTVGIVVYIRSAIKSPKEMQRSLDFSHSTMMRLLSEVKILKDNAPHMTEDFKLKTFIHELAGTITTAEDSYARIYNMRSRYFKKDRLSWQFLLMQKDFEKGVADMNTAMEEVARARSRYISYQDDLWKGRLHDKMQQQQECLDAIMQRLEASEGRSAASRRQSL